MAIKPFPAPRPTPACPATPHITAALDRIDAERREYAALEAMWRGEPRVREPDDADWPAPISEARH